MRVTYGHAVASVAALLGSLTACGALSWSAQPPGRVSFSNSTGSVVRCVPSASSASTAEHASPRPQPAVTVTWLGEDGAPLADLPGIREVSVNGSLVFRPFAASVWSAAVHATRYRCRAAQAGNGAILSRPVYVTAVLDTWWEVSVVQPVPGAGLLVCSASPPTLGPHLLATGWSKDGRPLSRAELRDGSLAMSSDGLMLVVWSADPHSSYSCSVANQLTGHTRRSQPRTIHITESSMQSAPMIIRAPPVTASAGSEVRLLCVATGNPPPHYSWFRESLGRLVPVPSGAGAGVLAMQATRAEAGGWACRAHNALGEARAHLTLTVLDPLRVTVSPRLHTADAGSIVTLNCSAVGGTATGEGDGSVPAAAVRWLHDGTPDGTTAWQLTVRAARHTAGMYQCEVTSGDLVDSDTAELRIGESAPELVYTFIEQAVRGGAALSLRCRAAGSPPPTVGWLLDGEPVDRGGHAPHRSVSQWSTSEGEIEWQLNVSVARAADGGRYTCRAVNSRGTAEHSARLNIYGPPAVRSVGPVRAVAGRDVIVHCPYSGFPISDIRWQREGVDIGGMSDARNAASDTRRVTVTSDGALRLRAADASDAGRYVCRVTDPQGHYAQNDLQIFVRIPPKISGFSFPADLTEGSSVQVLCGITSGDRPIYFSWLKDGKHIPSNLQIKEKSQDEFSFLIFSHLSSSHSGDYTCVATNSAAEVNHTATLTVKVAPSWEQEPTDVATLLGSQVVLPCATRGHPSPRVQWTKESMGAGSAEEWREVSELDQYALHANGSVVVGAAAAHHEGRYRCSADNGVGRPLAKTITLTVNEPAHFEFPSRNVTVKRASAARLTCDARGDPPLTVSWTHDNKPLDLNTYRLSVSEKRSSLGLTSTLSIAQAQRGDSGAYRCRADNAYGADEMLLYLAVQEYPEAPGGLRVVWATSRSARVWWRRGYDGNARVSAYRVQQRAVGTASPGVHDWLHAPTLLLHADTLTDRADPASDSPGVEYEVVGLRPATAYALRVAAVNDIGDSDYSQPVVVNTKEEAPSEPPHSVEVLANVPGELLVTWQAPPQDSWHGSLLGYVVWWRASGQPTQTAAQTLSVRGWGSSRAVLAPLLPATTYAVRVRAFNAEGPGPPAPAVTVNTLDGVPSAPVSVRCAALSPQSARAWWDPPADAAQGSRPTGYELTYEAVDSASPAASWRRVSVSKPDAVLVGLRAGTNYTVLVQARTAAGLGPACKPVYCRMHDDLPGAPSSVSAAAASESALAVRWLTPDAPNGRLTHYTLYYRLQRSGSPLSLVVPYSGGTVEQGAVVRGLSAAPHELWLTATNSRGEGGASNVLVRAPMRRAPAKLLSFPRMVTQVVGTRVTLPCAAAGSPPPLRQWSRRRVTTPLADDPRLLLDGEILVILSLDSSVADNYTCLARNPWGEERIELAVHVLLPPSPPTLRVRHVGVASGTLAWDSEPQRDTPGVTTASFTGFTLEYAPEGSSSWTAVYLPGSVRDYTLTRLSCGALYRARIRAHSAIGVSANSREVAVDTKSGKSSPPTSEELLSANNTCVRVNLLLWDSGGCSVRGWEVAWRVPSGPWQMLSVAPDEGPLTICELQPASWYQLGVRPLTDLSPTLHHMYVSTLTADGVRIPAMSSLPDGPDSGGGAGRLAAAGAALGAVLAALMLGAAVWRKRCSACAAVADAPLSTTSGKSSSGGPRDCQQLYSCSPTTKLTKDHDLYEISPYATFSMSDAAPPNPLRVPAPPGSNKHRSPLNPEEYTLSRAMTLAVRRGESDSESSGGSPCCECSHQPQPQTQPATQEVFPTGPVTDSSCESTDARSLSSRGGAAGGAGGGAGSAPSDRRRRNRRHHTPNHRYPAPPRQQQERRDFTIHV